MKTTTARGFVSGKEVNTMRSFLRHRPSPAVVLACLALVVALGGTSYAASQLPANSVGAKQLKKNAVTSAKVRNNSLTGRDIKESSLSDVRYARESAYSEDADTLDGLHSYDLHLPVGLSGYGISTGSPVTITSSNSVVSATVMCPAGKIPLGGGASLGNGGAGGGIRLVQSYTIAVGNSYGWRVTVANNWGETTTLTPYVICAQAPSTS